ncbi:disulfide bond formation protein B [Gammaproteobacteria bacterium]|nr:disulfide bond formation protein B [Gammaproteobacteria bacterium]
MSDNIPSTRNLNWIIGFGCMFLICAALYMEYVMHLEPCPLCIFQRVAVISTGLIAIVAAMHNPLSVGARIYGLMVVLASVVGSALAARQLYLQSLPEDKVPSCGPGLDYLIDVFPMQDVIKMVLVGDGSCAEVAWTLLGISIPGWTLVGFIGLITLGLFQTFRQNTPSF